MHLKNHPPILVPEIVRDEIEKLSKAALMDIAWCFATRCAGHEGDPGLVMAEFRRERDVVLGYRKQWKGAA